MSNVNILFNDRKFYTAFFTSIPRYQNWSFLKDYDQMVSFEQTFNSNAGSF